MVCRMWARGSSAHIPTASSASAKGGPASSRKGKRRGAYIMLRRPCTHMPIYIYIYMYISCILSSASTSTCRTGRPPRLRTASSYCRTALTPPEQRSPSTVIHPFISIHIHLFNHLFIQSFMHSLIHSFICVIHIVADCGRLVSDRSVYLSVYLSVCL